MFSNLVNRANIATNLIGTMAANETIVPMITGCRHISSRRFGDNTGSSVDESVIAAAVAAKRMRIYRGELRGY